MTSNNDDSRKSAKSGAKSRKEGEEYEKAASHSITAFLREHYENLSVEPLCNVKIDQKNHYRFIKRTKERLVSKDWTFFQKNNNVDNFEEIEIDFILKLVYNDPDAPKDSSILVSIPFNLGAKDEGLCYEINVGKEPVIICCQATKSPTNLLQKLWQMEKTIAIFEVLKDEIVNSTESDDIKKLKKWITASKEILYSIVSNENEDMWMENFVSKLCIFNEQISFNFATIIKEMDLKKELIQLLIKNDVDSLIKKCHEKKILKRNCLSNSHLGKALSKGKLLFLFVNVSLDEVLEEVRYLRQELKQNKQIQSEQSREIEELKKKSVQMQSDHERQIDEQSRQIGEQSRQIDELKGMLIDFMKKKKEEPESEALK